MTEKRKRLRVSGNIAALAAFAITALIFLFGLSEADTASEDEEKRFAEDSVRRAVVSCYALEGSYPDSFEYIKSNYGVRIDESKYYVHYEIFASNIMPEITIVER